MGSLLGGWDGDLATDIVEKTKAPEKKSRVPRWLRKLRIKKKNSSPNAASPEASAQGNAQTVPKDSEACDTLHTMLNRYQTPNERRAGASHLQRVSMPARFSDLAETRGEFATKSAATAWWKTADSAAFNAPIESEEYDKHEPLDSPTASEAPSAPEQLSNLQRMSMPNPYMRRGSVGLRRESAAAGK